MSSLCTRFVFLLLPFLFWLAPARMSWTMLHSQKMFGAVIGVVVVGQSTANQVILSTGLAYVQLGTKTGLSHGNQAFFLNYQFTFPL
jgi:hypothetical protein